jgi:hypothetical protein
MLADAGLLVKSHGAHRIADLSSFSTLWRKKDHCVPEPDDAVLLTSRGT